MNEAKRSAGNAGFTLVELMIVVAIVAILATVALPAYRQHVIDSRRAEASSCLLQLAQFMERSYSERFAYEGDLDGDGNDEGVSEDLPDLQCVNELDGDYAFGIDAVAAESYALEAVPEADQRADSNGGADARECGTLEIDQAGEKVVTGSGSVDTCW